MHAAEQERPDVAARRTLWRAAQPLIDSESLVFLDETGVNTKMARLDGRAPVGERCRDRVPFGHRKTMTFIAGLRMTGMTAPWVLDNLPAHKVAGIREAITARRAHLFYLPPYSPDMNPIEMAFAKLKALLRQQPARTVDALVKRIGELLNRLTPAECAIFFHAAGYRRSR